MRRGRGPGGMRADLRLPTLSCGPGASPAQALRGAADGKASPMVPTSTTITAAAGGPTPGAVRRSRGGAGGREPAGNGPLSGGQAGLPALEVVQDRGDHPRW